MKSTVLRKGLIFLLLGVFLVSGAYAVKTLLDYQQEAAIYEEAQTNFVTVIEVAPAAVVTQETKEPIASDEETQIEESLEEVVELPPPDPLVPNITVNFSGLMALNSDIVGWIYMPATDVNYPLLQGANNQSYVSVAYDGKYSAAGSIFLDYRINGDFTSENTVIYGHNMSSTGMMFNDLHNYKKAGFIDEHPYIFILTEQGYFRYEVCYAMTTEATSDVYDYDFSQEGSFAKHLQMLSVSSVIQTDVTVTDQDRIITLSTCTGVEQLQRFVVIARLAEEVIL